MKKRITGAITFLLGLGTILTIWISDLASDLWYIKSNNYSVTEVIFQISGLVTLGVSAILYVYWNEFGDDQEIFKVERENKLLKSKIEQKKLRKELEKD
jgi:hypothetical protein